MRIISQDGNLDAPYDQIAISAGFRGDQSGYIITAHFTSKSFERQILATYSTPEKAEKAMEMLHVAYTGRYITNADVSEVFDKTMQALMKHGLGTVVVRDRYDSRVEFGNLNGYFKFPDDEEIEV